MTMTCKLFYCDDDLPIVVQDVVTIEHVDSDEDGAFLIFWKSDGSGERYPDHEYSDLDHITIIF